MWQNRSFREDVIITGESDVSGPERQQEIGTAHATSE